MAINGNYHDHGYHHYCCRHWHKCSCGYCFDCGSYVAKWQPQPWSHPLGDGGGWIGGGPPITITYGTNTSCSHS